jgi:phosphopantothenoylcysteine synthetase/decarboxylase
MTAKPQRKSKQFRLVVAVTGSVGAVGVPNLVMHLRRSLQCRVRMVLTRAAQQFLTCDIARIASGCEPVLEGVVQGRFTVPHLELTTKARLLLVLPATANILGKAACGIADDLVSTTILAAPCPVLFVPGMNEVMWSNPIVRANVERLRHYGYEVLEPGTGIEVANLQPSNSAMAPFGEIVSRVSEYVIGSDRGVLAE